MPISPQQKAWLERFCKANRYQLDHEHTKDGIVVYKKPIGTNMIATIAYGEGSFSTRFMLVAGHHPYSGYQTIPWSLIGDGVNDLKLQLFASMSASWNKVFKLCHRLRAGGIKKI